MKSRVCSFCFFIWRNSAFRMFSPCCCLCLSCCPWNKVLMNTWQKPVFDPVLTENFTFVRPPRRSSFSLNFWFSHLNKSEGQWFISLLALTGNLGLSLHHVQEEGSVEPTSCCSPMQNKISQWRAACRETWMNEWNMKPVTFQLRFCSMRSLPLPLTLTSFIH